jgi:hypothetical protein
MAVGTVRHTQSIILERFEPTGASPPRDAAIQRWRIKASSYRRLSRRPQLAGTLDDHRRRQREPAQCWRHQVDKSGRAASSPGWIISETNQRLCLPRGDTYRPRRRVKFA